MKNSLPYPPKMGNGDQRAISLAVTAFTQAVESALAKTLQQAVESALAKAADDRARQKKAADDRGRQKKAAADRARQ